jgi:hypothetical protein
MEKALGIISLITQILPFLGSLFGLIKEAEETGLPGPEKAAQVMNQMGAAWGGIQGAVNPKTVVGRLDWNTVLQPAVKALLEVGVAIENAVGNFTHASAPEKFGI